MKRACCLVLTASVLAALSAQTAEGAEPKKMAMIKDGVVANVALWDGVSKWQPQGYTLIDVTNKPYVAPGYKYIDGTFSSPPAPSN